MQQFFSQVPGSVDVYGDGSAWTYPCDAKLGLSFDFGNGQVFSVNDADLILGPVTNDTAQCSSLFTGMSG